MSTSDRSTSPGELIGWLLRRQKAWVALGITTGIVWMASYAVSPIVVGAAVDDLIDEPTATRAGWWAAVVVVVYAIGALAGAVRHRAAVGLYVNSRWMVEQRISDRMLDRRGGVDRPAGEVLSVSIGDASKTGTIADLTNRGSGAVVTLVVVAVWLLATSVTLGLLVLVSVPLAAIVVIPFMRSYDRRSTEERRQLAEASAVAADGVTGLRVVQGLGGAREIRRWFREESEGMRHAALSLVRLESVLFSTMSLLPNLTLVPILWVGGTQAIDGDISPGTLITVVGLAQFLSTPIFTLGEVAQVLTAGRASARRAATVIDAPTRVDDADSTAPPVIGRSLELAGVTTERLHGIDFRAADDEFVGIVCAQDGDAEAVVDLLARRVDPTSGVIRVGGVDLRRVPLTQLPQLIVVADTERPWLRAGTLMDNLETAHAELDPETATAALRTAAAEDILHRRDPLAAPIGERGLRLSGGQRQRVALARSLVAEPRVRVVVEPTSALDAATEQRLVERLVDHRDGTTVVITTSPALLAACDRVTYVRDGRIVATGEHRVLEVDDETYRRLMRGGAE
ncbi:MAG: ABC transporter ATP-binding protein [Actinomycetota bacterium]